MFHLSALNIGLYVMCLKEARGEGERLLGWVRRWFEDGRVFNHIAFLHYDLCGYLVLLVPARRRSFSPSQLETMQEQLERERKELLAKKDMEENEKKRVEAELGQREKQLRDAK